MSNNLSLIFVCFCFAEHNRRLRRVESTQLPQPASNTFEKSTRDPSEIEPHRFIVTTSIIRNFNSTKFSLDDLQTSRVLGLVQLRHVHQVQQAPDRHSAVSATHGYVLQAPQCGRDRLEQVNGVGETDQAPPADHRHLVRRSIDAERGRSGLGLAVGVVGPRLCSVYHVLRRHRADLHQLHQAVEKDQEAI